MVLLRPRRPHSPSPSPSTSSAPATSAPTKPTSAVRVPARTRLGDLETADFCAGIRDLVGFEHLGEPAFHLYQVAGGCFIDVYTSSSNLMLVDIIGYQDIDEPGSADQPADLLDGADTTKNLGDGYSEATWQDDGTACRRAFGVAGSGSLARCGGRGHRGTAPRARARLRSRCRCRQRGAAADLPPLPARAAEAITRVAVGDALRPVHGDHDRFFVGPDHLRCATTPGEHRRVPDQ